jgi:D-beta-D-heptose 7-phosphate kinase/D-beta-D-heptose 1-phosphate adenosyltransferase
MTQDPVHRGSSSAGVLEGLEKVTVLILGDVMLDEYVWGDVHRISPEAPVPVVEFRTRSQVLGGAANAAANIVSLTGQAFLGGVVGQDTEAEALRGELARIGIDAHLQTDHTRPTTTKTRFIGGAQQILRVDREQRPGISTDIEASLLAWAAGCLPSADCMLISDYGKGVVTARTCQELVRMARVHEIPVVIDPKGRDYSKYEGATVLTPNAIELRSAVEPLSLSSGGLQEDVTTLQSVIQGTALVVTRGAEGVTVFPPEGQAQDIPARRRTVFDVTGAGDTLVATLALAIGAGASLTDAAIVANEAAGIVVGKVGTATLNLDELRTELASLPEEPTSIWHPGQHT